METLSGIQRAIEADHSSPEARYAELHKRIEAGDDGERVWADLSKVCLVLGKDEEALEAYGKLSSFGPRSRTHALLVDKGLLEAGSVPKGLETTCVTDDDMEPTFSEGVSDALQFLVRGRVPLVAMAGMVAFGVLLLLGGLLHRLAGIVAVSVIILPIAIAMLGVVTAFSMRILMLSVSGFDDPPDLPDRNEVIAESKNGALVFSVAAVMLLTPGVLLHWLFSITVVSMLVLSTGWALLPLVVTIRRLSDSWRASGPAQWWRVSKNTRGHVPMVLLANLAMFAPAALAMQAALDQPAYLVASFAGLLSVVPLLASMRMLGQILYYERKNLRGVLEVEQASGR